MIEKISEKELKHKSRRLNIKSGIFAAGKVSFGDRFLQPFAIAINMSNSIVALLTSLAGLLGPLSQSISSNIFQKHSRKKVVLNAVFLESLIWIPFIAIAILFSKGIYPEILPLMLLLTFSTYVIVGNSFYPHWFSWTGDIVDAKYRGRWFSKRTLITSFVTVVVATASSFFLDYFNKLNLAMIGFAILFGLAMISRLLSWASFKKQYEPKLKIKKGSRFSFKQFLKDAPKSNFGKFAIFRTLFVFSGAIFSSLFAVYILRYIGLNYSTYMIITLSEVVFSIAVMNFWGTLADKYGNYKVLFISTMIIPILPILWILHPNPIYFVFVPAFASGVIWAGFRLATNNFIYDNVEKDQREFAVSYYNLMLGIGIFLGGIVSAILIKLDKIFTIDSIIFIFLASSIIRMAVVWCWIPKVKEVRKTKKMNSKSFRKNIINQIKPSIMEEIHEISSIKGYLKE